MTKKHFSTAIVFLLSLSLLITFTSCGNRSSESASQVNPSTTGDRQGLPPANVDENHVFGVFNSFENNTLTIDVVDMRGGGPGGMHPIGSRPESGQFPQSIPEGETPPERPEGQNGERPGGPGGKPVTTGETLEIVVTNDTKITSANETLKVEDMVQGDMLVVEIDKDGETAISIEVMRQMRGEQG